MRTRISPGISLQVTWLVTRLHKRRLDLAMIKNHVDLARFLGCNMTSYSVIQRRLDLLLLPTDTTRTICPNILFKIRGFVAKFSQ